MISTIQLASTLTAIDDANKEDPNITQINGKNIAVELLYGQRMSNQLNAFKPDASPELQIATRAQHIKRWSLPRKDFPMDRAGYYKWRIQLGRFHADVTAKLMQEHKINSASIEQVKSLLQKEKLKTSPETQALEDVICLVFLEHYMDAFAAKHEEQKVISILQKTWAKMSEKGHNAALQLPLADHLLTLVKKALA